MHDRWLKKDETFLDEIKMSIPSNHNMMNMISLRYRRIVIKQNFQIIKRINNLF